MQIGFKVDLEDLDSKLVEIIKYIAHEIHKKAEMDARMKR